MGLRRRRVRPVSRVSAMSAGIGGFGAFAAASLTLAAFLPNCSNVYDVSAPDGDGAVDGPTLDAFSAPDAGPVDPCAHVGPPPKAAQDDNPTADVGDLTFAFRTTSILGTLGLDASALPNVAPTRGVGFDLDRNCTCQVGSPQGSCTAMTAKCDGDGGVDDSLPAIFSLFTALQPNANVDDLAGANAAIAAGDRTLLLSIRRYNGLANDGDVTVIFSVATRPDQAPAPGCAMGAGDRPPAFPPDPEGGARLPVWDGCDRWGVLSQTPPIAAYVTNHRLVVTTTVAAQMLLGGGTADLEGPTLTAALQPRGDGTFTLEDGMLAGRVPSASLLLSMGQLRLSGDAGPLCQASVVQQGLLRNQVCGARDIASSAAQDNFSGAACTALSVAQAFRAEPAVAGDPMDASAAPGPCADAAPLACP